MPKVSVIMPVFNGERYLAAAIRSVLAQCFTDFELLIINDGSSDQSAAIIEGFNDPRIRCIENPKNIGITATRNIGLSQARGEYIAMLDCDDVALENRLKAQVTFLDEHPEVAMLAGWAIYEKPHQDGLLVRTPWRIKARSERIPSILLFGNYFIQSTVMLRKSAIPADGYRGEGLAEDYDLWARIASKHPAYLLNQPLVLYRVHSGGITQRDATSLENACRKVVAWQLQRLGLLPTEAELDLHRQIANGKPAFTLTELHAAGRWLSTILAANAAHSVYDSVALAGVVANFWLFSCVRSVAPVRTRFATYRASPLAQAYRLCHLGRLAGLAWERALLLSQIARLRLRQRLPRHLP